VKIKNIVDYAREIAPFETAAEWDNIGLLVGDENADVMRVLLALDITNEVVKEAREKGCGLIVSHHPVIFDPLRALAPADPVYSLAKNDIAALCLHTNLDRAERGVNTALAEALGLKNITLYPDCYLAVGDTDREYGADEYAALIKERLGAPSVRYTDGKVSRVAVSSGGGGEGVELSAEYGFEFLSHQSPVALCGPQPILSKYLPYSLCDNKLTLALNEYGYRSAASSPGSTHHLCVGIYFWIAADK
jgi:dinuclear metal center YbgI/SA1388 family protein